MIRSLFVPRPLSVPASAGVLVLRAFVGFAFMNHGWFKIQNPFGWMGPQASTPGVFQALAALSEFGGGLAWILGLLTPLASVGIAFTMTVAAWTHLVALQDPLFPTRPGQGSAELAVVFLCVAVLLLLAGPGRFSVDGVLFRGKKAAA